jgi:hypothetical protein
VPQYKGTDRGGIPQQHGLGVSAHCASGFDSRSRFKSFSVILSAVLLCLVMLYAFVGPSDLQVSCAFLIPYSQHHMGLQYVCISFSKQRHLRNT